MTDLLENQYDNDKFIDYYKILDLDMEASVEEIKTNYIKHAKKYHPDQELGNTEMFQLVSKAYEVLHNKESRKEYDLYFLKKSFNELQEDNFFGMKDNFNSFINSNDKKKISKDELDKLYDDVFKDKEQYTEKKIDLNETSKRLNDINLERESDAIEELDESLQKFITLHPDVKVNEIFEYIKKNNYNENTEIINTEIKTLDTLPSYLDNNYSSFDNSGEGNGGKYFSEIDNNSFVSNPKEEVSKIDMRNFNEWKNTRKLDSRLNSEDIDYYLHKRKEEEELLLHEVETTLVNNVKKRINKVQINSVEDIKKVDVLDNIKKR